MIRTLSSKGLDLEQYFKTLDPNNRGLLNRKKFFSILKQIGLPYGNRELNDITQHYTVPSSDQADYISLLKDTGIIMKVVEDNGTTSSNSVNNNGNNSHGNNQSVNPATDNIDISIYTIVISDVKRMILESISSRSKHQDDVYRMFARWDTQGTGTITATQFLRVLAKLHINLTDQDQDFLVELLDTNGMGRIDFEGLLNFCFSTDKLQSPSTNVYRNNNNSNNNNTLLSPTTNTFSASSFSVDDNKDGGETMSAVSTEGNTSLEHRGSGSSDNHHHHINNFNISSRRPHTASLSRPYHSSLQANYYGSNSNINNNNSNSSNHTHRIEHTSSSTTNGIMTSNINDKNNNNNSNINNNRVYLPSSNAKSPPQRPLTASGRVISSQKNKFSPATVVLLDRENSQYVVELPDDVIYGEENYLSVDNTNLKQQQQKQQKQLQQQQQQQQINVGGKLPYTGILNNNNNNNNNNISSFNNFITEVNDNNDENNNIRTVKYVPQDQFIEQFSSQVMTNNNDNNYNNRNLNNGNNIYSYNYIPSTTYIPSGSINILNNNNNNIGNVSNNSNINSNDPATMIDAKLNIISRQNSSNNINNNNTNIMNNAHHNNRQVGINNSAQFLSTAAAAEPSEHLVLLATQILTTLREIIMTRYRRGKSLLEIYGHFDRECKQYFDANDFIIATADLKIETSNRVANIAINLIAIDGYDKVSFGEFKVFVLDSDHKLLEMNIQEQIAQFLEQKGREYQSYMIDMFWNEDDSNDIDNNNHNYNNNQNNHIHRKQHKYQQTENEFLSRNRFINSLQKIGLILTSTEESRIADRFDIHGNDMCCISRFIYMIQNSRAWKHAEQVLAFQDEAIEEAIFLRQQLKLGQKHISDSDLPQISEELISMCEYLGIRVLSERNMIWIAADALKAPLPISWTAQKDSNGRIFFFNHLTNQSKLEHPLDPHFRKLRDKYRQRLVTTNIFYLGDSMYSDLYLHCRRLDMNVFLKVLHSYMMMISLFKYVCIVMS
jgi:Ca2+-binding EF-hand superfamily protein